MGASAAAGLEIQPLTGRIGAVLAGVELGSESESEVRGIRQALLAHRVVFFRDQHLSVAEQIAFSRRLGPLTRSHPTLSSPSEHPEIHEVDSAIGSQADYWHTDVTFVRRVMYLDEHRRGCLGNTQPNAAASGTYCLRDAASIRKARVLLQQGITR